MGARGLSQRGLATGNQRGLPLISDDRTLQAPISESDIEAGVSFLVAQEPRFGAVIKTYGLPPARHVENCLPSLLKIVTEQLISLQAADAIWQRIESSLHPFAPEEIFARSEAELKSLGLSGAKARSFIALSQAVVTGDLNFHALAKMGDEDALRKLISLPGIGPWTADIYLLTALGRTDACPSGDLALQVAAQHLLGMDERPTPKDFLALAEAWRPWRSVAARLLWSHYRGLKGITQRVN